MTLRVTLIEQARSFFRQEQAIASPLPPLCFLEVVSDFLKVQNEPLLVIAEQSLCRLLRLALFFEFTLRFGDQALLVYV